MRVILENEKVNVYDDSNDELLFHGTQEELGQLLRDARDIADDIADDIDAGHISEDNKDIAFENYVEFSNKYKTK